MKHTKRIAALLLALVELPDFSTPINSIALSLEKLSGRERSTEPPSEWNDLLSDDDGVEAPRRPAASEAAAPPATGAQAAGAQTAGAQTAGAQTGRGA